MVDFNKDYRKKLFGKELRADILKPESISKQPKHNPRAEGKYDQATGMVSFQTAPAPIAKILKDSGALQKFNIPQNATVGFKIEEGRKVANYSGLVPNEYIQGIKAGLGQMTVDENKTNIMSAFITHNGRDIHVASVLIMPNEQNLLFSNPALNSIQKALYALMRIADKISSPIRSSALRLKPPEAQRDGIYFYKLKDLGQEYKPLINYMHNFQKTNPATAKDAYLAIREFQAEDLPPDLRKAIQQDESQRSGKALTTDQTIITAVSFSSDTDKPAAPVLLFTNTSFVLAYTTEEFKKFIAKQKNITEEQAADLARLLFNKYAAAK